MKSQRVKCSCSNENDDFPILCSYISDSHSLCKVGGNVCKKFLNVRNRFKIHKGRIKFVGWILWKIMANFCVANVTTQIPNDTVRARIDNLL